MLGVTVNKQATEDMPPQHYNSAPSENLVLQPRVVRLKYAPGYLGIDKNTFNAKVRPFIREVRMGKQSVAFDRLELDIWFDDHMKRNGRRPIAETLEDDKCLNATKCRGSVLKAKSGKSRNDAKMPKVAGSGKAREHLAALKQSKS